MARGERVIRTGLQPQSSSRLLGSQELVVTQSTESVVTCSLSGTSAGSVTSGGIRHGLQSTFTMVGLYRFLV